MRDCSIEILIENVVRVNLLETYDFHLIESPAQIVAPLSEYEVQDFPESAAPEMDRRVVKQPFDYTISLGFWGPESELNARIRTFYNSLFSYTDTDIMESKEVELFNHYKNVKMKGFAKKWDEQTYTIAGEKGLLLFDFTLYVNDPNTLMDIR